MIVAPSGRGAIQAPNEPNGDLEIAAPRQLHLAKSLPEKFKPLEWYRMNDGALTAYLTDFRIGILPALDLWR